MIVMNGDFPNGARMTAAPHHNYGGYMKENRRNYIAVSLFVFICILSVPAFATVGTVELDSDDIYFDIQGYDNDVTHYIETQSKVNISSIPNGYYIESAIYCDRIISETGMDTDIYAYRVDDQTWDDSITSGSYNAQTTSTSTSSTINSTTTNTYTCFDITSIISADYSASNENNTLRFGDPDSPLTSSQSIEDKENRIGNILGAYIEMESEDNYGSTGDLPKYIINYTDDPYAGSGCQQWIDNETMPFDITESNSVYCMNQSFSWGSSDAVSFSAGVVNTTLDCRGLDLYGDDTSNTEGIYLTDSTNAFNTIENCNMYDFFYGIKFNGADSNTILNNTITSSTSYSIYFDSGSDNNTIINTSGISGYSGIRLYSNDNNITGGYFEGTGLYTYDLQAASTNNIFTNTNFTSQHRIRLVYPSEFIYRNDTTSGIVLSTNSTSSPAITRTLNSWSDSNMSWTESTSASETLGYNITGLQADTNYFVYNFSQQAYSLTSDSNGEIGFFIDTNSTSRQIEVTLDVISPYYTGNQSSLVSSYNPNGYSNFSVTWTDNSEDANAYIENNLTSDGSFTNTSMSGTYPDFYYNSTTVAVGGYMFRFIATDGTNENATEWRFFTISKSALAIDIYLYLNGTIGHYVASDAQNDQQNILNGTAVNLTAVTGNGTTMNISIAWTGFGATCFGGSWATNYGLESIENETLVNCTSLPTTDKTVYAEAGVGDHQNYTLSVSTSSNNKIYTYIDDLALDDIIYDTTVYQYQTQTINSTFGLANSTKDIIGTLVYDGTAYSNTSSSMNDSFLTLRFNFDTPTIPSESHTSPFIVNYTYGDGASQKVNLSSSEYTQTIYKPTLTVCNSTLQEFMYLEFLNETNDFGRVNTSIEATFGFTYGSYDYVYNFTTINETYRICGYPSTANFTVNGEIKYTGNSTYYTRYYNFDREIVDNTSTLISFYNINGDMGTVQNTEIITKDSEGNTYPEVVVKIQRYYPELDNSTDDGYRTIAAPISDSYGKTNAYLLTGNVEYRFILWKNGQILRIIDKTTITDSSLSLTLDPSDLIALLRYWNLITGSCSYSGSSGYMTCSYSDLSGGYMDSASLRVTQTGALINSQVCSSTNSTTPSGTMLCYIGNATNSVYSYTLWANLIIESESFTNTYVLDSGMLNEGKATSMIFGFCSADSEMCIEGLFVTFMVILTGALVAIWKPTVSIVYTLMAVVITSTVGLFQIGIESLIGLIMVGVLIIFILIQKRR